MIAGSHVVVYTRDAEADRAFFRDVLRLPVVDAGGGWLVFALPPSEVAFHPAEIGGAHELFLMCVDLPCTVDRLRAQGIACDGPIEERWGIRTAIHLPGGGRMGLYQPKHPTAIRMEAK